MGLTPTFTGEDITGAFQDFKDSKEAKFIEIFKYVGEQFVNHCRDLRTYRDQTGNLRSSIGFIIAVDGEIKEENWNGDQTGIAHGKDTANKVLQTSQSGRIGGVILDDLPTEHAHSARLRLSMLSNEVHRMDGSVIVTSAKPPSPNLQGCFGDNGPNVVNVPYLSRDEVAELVKLADGDAQKWADVVYSFCGFGHPQLVQVRISGLRQRNWPNAELLDGIPGFGGSAKEIEEQCDSIRERLPFELLPNTRGLLYRLTLLVGYFDRELAIAVGEVDPRIDSPGEALDILLGPWIEVMASDRFRVSPLVSSAGSKTLGKPVKMEVHKRVVDNLIARCPFPADFLGTLLGHAIGSRHVQVHLFDGYWEDIGTIG